MKRTDVIIIGAGAAGLMAAYTLGKADKTVTVLEARNRIGGRIHTFSGNSFSKPVELGAEFIHGNLPVTLELLKEAGISKSAVRFEMWRHHNNTFEESDEFVEGWNGFLEKLNGLQYDMPMADFLKQNFPGEKYTKMCRQIENYVAGYDTADIHDASAFALRDEWNHEDEDAQHRVDGGYGAMLEYLADACRNAGNDILLGSVAKTVRWSKGKVEVTTADNGVYEAGKVIVALPAGVLQADGNAEGSVQFYPQLHEQAQAMQDIGFGSVIKILLEFKEPFWEKNEVTGTALATMGFLFSDEEIPTFWTQAPTHSPLLTGWIGGPPANAKKDLADEDILGLALISLGNIFRISPKNLRHELSAWHVANWSAEPYTRGSYAYDKVNSAEARKTLHQPIENTVYFTGEYLYDGPAKGTVEAALAGGRTTAEILLSSLRQGDY